MIAGMEMVDATGGASPLPYEKRVGYCGFGKVGEVTIPPVVARIFSGDSTSPLTREASVMVQSKGWCGFAIVVGDGSIRYDRRSEQGK